MLSVGFTVTFHSPFRVGASSGDDGVDVMVDAAEPLAGDHLKGLMRAAARDVLRVTESSISEVFGSRSSPSPWSWSAAEPDRKWELGTRHRVATDDATHSALTDHLVLGQHAWSPTATFRVDQKSFIETHRHSAQVALLRCSGAAVHNVGGWRRRGLGWVGITPEPRIITSDLRSLDRAGAK